MKSVIGEFLKNLMFSKKMKGELELAFGIHEIFIPIKKFKTKQIMLEFDNCNIGNCSGNDSDSFDYSIVEDGFVLKANIKTNKRSVKWLASEK